MRQNTSGNNFDTLLTKAQRFCAYQERCEMEVVEKLIKWKASHSDIELVLKVLKKDGFLDNERFLESYIKGKINLKRWGIHKIYKGLKRKGFDESTINAALKVFLDEKTQKENAMQLAQKKCEKLKTVTTIKQKEKLFRYLLSKGYPKSIVYDVVNQLIP